MLVKERKFPPSFNKARDVMFCDVIYKQELCAAYGGRSNLSTEVSDFKQQSST